MAGRRKVFAWGAAALTLVGATAIKYGDDVFRNFSDDAGRAGRSALDTPPRRSASRLPRTPPPHPSRVWRSLEELKKDVSKEISTELGYVDEEKAGSVAEELLCALT